MTRKRKEKENRRLKARTDSRKQRYKHIRRGKRRYMIIDKIRQDKTRKPTVTTNV